MATLSLKEASRYLEFGVLPVKDGSKTRQHSGVWRSKTDVPGSDNNSHASRGYPQAHVRLQSISYEHMGLFLQLTGDGWVNPLGHSELVEGP